MEPVSPELVLVDPALGDRVQARLPQPDDTLARVDSLVHASRRASLARRSMEPPRRLERQRVERTRRRSRPTRSAALAGGVAAGTLVVALLLGVRIDLAGNPAGADTTVIDTVPAVTIPEAPDPGPAPQPQPDPDPQPEPEPEPKSAPPRPAAPRPAVKPPNRVVKPARKPEPQRFAWAPVPNASGYHVELFLGSSRVFEADTSRPTLTIPARWRFGGRSRSLEHGDYRWYVWPVLGGQRAARAIVQARLDIPAR